jgi:DNA-binding PadR family transcriptional regulator
MGGVSEVHRAFLQGAVKLFVLQRAGEGPVYGNAIARELEQLGHRISSGTLYPILHSLEQQGLLLSTVRVNQGRLRRYYTLTDGGRTCLEQTRDQVSPLIGELLGRRPAAAQAGEAESKRPPAAPRDAEGASYDRFQ